MPSRSGVSSHQKPDRPLTLPPRSAPFDIPSSHPTLDPSNSPLPISESAPGPSRFPQSSSSRGFSDYKPRSATLISGGAGRSSAKDPTASAAGLDNWETLQELVGHDESDDDDETAGNSGGGVSQWTGRSLARPAASRMSSHRSLRSIFAPRPGRDDAVERGRTSPRPAEIFPRNGPLTEEEESGVLSMSPPRMDGFGDGDEGVQRQRPDDEAGATGLESVLEEADASQGAHGGSRTPLLHERGSPSRTRPSVASHWRPPDLWPPSPAAIAIFKCSVAYFIASLFTFVPQLAALLSTASEMDAHGRVTKKPAYSAHMVATIVVYFNPAKTYGHMLLASRFCFLLALMATLVSIAAMLTIASFDHFSPSQGSRWDWISEVGDWVVCILWIGGSMGWLAWAKVWVGNPSFNSGCSMAAVTLYTVIIKEGNLPKLAEVLLIVAIGAFITNVVCFTIFPSSATTRLQTSISRSLDSFSTLLDLLTSTFLLERTVLKTSQLSLRDAVQSHASAFKTLKTDLAEAKHERVLDGRVRGKKLELYDAAIGSLSRLAQHLAGLRGSTRLQESLIRASREGRIDLTQAIREKGSEDQGWQTMGSMTRSIVLGKDRSPGPDLADVDIETSVRLFLLFREISGQQMDDLVAQCDKALDAVQAISETHHPAPSHVDLQKIRTELASSLRDFTQSSSRAIKRVYAGPRRQRGLHEGFGELDPDSSGDDSETEAVGEQPGLQGGPNETVFLIYFFLFTLEEFAREMLFLLDTVREILSADSVSAWDYVRSVWPTKRGKKEKRTEFLYKQLRQVVPIDPSKLQPPLFPRPGPDSANASRYPTYDRSTAFLTTHWSRVKHLFWAFGDFLRRPDIRYALKTGLGGALLASPAYTEVGRPIFLEYKGEWALIAYFATMSPTVGQTNFLSFFRVVGTILGAAVAVVFYSIFPDNPIILPALGFLFSIPCFYIITQMPDYAQAGRFILLTYNLSCLYAYNQRERDVTVISIAWHRSISVILGVIWAAIVSRYWWPFTARRELRMGVSDFCLDLSYLYSKLVTTYSRGVDPPEQPLNGTAGQDGEQEPLLPVGSARHPHLSPSVRQFMAMELHLQSQLATLRELLNQTRNEPRLKGPFAYGFYKEVLLSLERMVDRLHSMRCVTTRDKWDNGIRRAFVAPVNKQRRDMAGNVILYFYTLSAGFRLRTPMPPYLPPAESARQRLVDAIRDLDVVKRRSVRGGGRHLLFFAYALAMQEVIAELDYLGAMMQDEFGVISQSTVIDFEALFQASPSVLDVKKPRAHVGVDEGRA